MSWKETELYFSKLSQVHTIYYIFEGSIVANDLWAIKIHLIEFQKYYK